MDDSFLSDAAPSVFTLVGSLHLHAPSRLPENACCPNKDLVLVISGGGPKEKLLLLNLEGHKKWETDATIDGMDRNRIVSVAWSPDGQSIALAHDPPRVSIHSVQDGKEERSLVLQSMPDPNTTLQNLWWFTSPQPFQDTQIPDVFQRNGIITGSALSVMRSLPLLDALTDSSQQLTANELFAFQGLQAKTVRKVIVPESVKNWPALPSNPRLASIQTSSEEGANKTSGETTADAAPRANTVLVVSDSSLHIHAFLDGGFALGLLHTGHPILSLHHAPNAHMLLATQQYSSSEDYGYTTLIPTPLNLPLINLSIGRQLAELSSSLRELLGQMLRVMKEMREAWFGVDGRPGARDIAPRWLKALEERQRKHTVEQPSPVVDLMTLLITGVKSKGMEDFMTSNDFTSERSLHKWESIIGDAICKIRDHAEFQIAAACQRVHLILEDIYGMAIMSNSQILRIDPVAVLSCLQITQRTLTVAVYVASYARRDFPRLKHFIAWLRYESSKISSADPPPIPALQHDVLEVSEYLTAGIDGEVFDAFFAGSLPSNWGHSSVKPDLSSVLREARIAVDSPKALLSARESPHDPTATQYNLEALIEQLAVACHAACTPASNTVSASAVHLAPPRVHEAANVRVISSLTDDTLQQHLALWSTAARHSGLVCFAKFSWKYNASPAADPAARVDAVLCRIDPASLMDVDDSSEERLSVHITDVRFFDEHEALFACKTDAGDSCIARLRYRDLVYVRLNCDGTAYQEEIWCHALAQLYSNVTTLSIGGCHPLEACKTGVGAIAVNGRPKRRFACVLDTQGAVLEVYDLSGGDAEETVPTGVGEPQ